MFTTRQRTKGQALVEFALAATLIFVLLSAAIDLGLIFFRHQGLYNASLEGASYGSRFVKTFTAAEIGSWSQAERLRRGCDIVVTVQAVCIDEQAVRARITSEDGGGTNLVNLKDLNADGIPDDQQADVKENYITVWAVSNELDPEAPGSTCPDITHPPVPSSPCYIYVNLKSDYHMFFALAPAFGDSVAVSAHTLYPIRAQIQTNANVPPGTSLTNTPTKTPTNTATPTATPTTPVPVGQPIPPENGAPTATATTGTGTNPSDTPGIENPGGPGETPATATATKTPGPTKTATKTHTPGPSPTRKPTNTFGPTKTPGPTRTATKKPTTGPTKVPGATRPPSKPTRTATTQGT